MNYPISTTPAHLVDHAALSALVDRVSQPGTKAALVGWGEYAKHLINLRPENVVAVFDSDEKLEGIKFRDVPVINSRTRLDTNLIVACEYKYAYQYVGLIAKFYPDTLCFFSDTLHYKSTGEINVFEQEVIYQQLFKDVSDAPASMMSDKKLQFLVELLRPGLTFQGDIVEMGSWQGGSTSHIAKTLSLLNEDGKVFAMYLFETHMLDPTATMCTDEIRRRLGAVYSHYELIIGLIDDPDGLATIPGPFCFAHVDLGPIPGALEFLWQRLQPGAPLVLDNYGHIQATWAFDAFFEAKKTRVTRLPWSEEGLVFKR